MYVIVFTYRSVSVVDVATGDLRPHLHSTCVYVYTRLSSNAHIARRQRTLIYFTHTLTHTLMNTPSSQLRWHGGKGHTTTTDDIVTKWQVSSCESKHAVRVVFNVQSIWNTLHHRHRVTAPPSQRACLCLYETFRQKYGK